MPRTWTELLRLKKYIPKGIVTTNCSPSFYNSTIECRGCSKSFPTRKTESRTCNVGIPRVDYYVHCVEECPDFAKLGLISKCWQCPLIFLSANGRQTHFTTRHDRSKARTFGDNRDDCSNTEARAPDFLEDYKLDDDILELSLEINFPEAFREVII